MHHSLWVRARARVRESKYLGFMVRVSGLMGIVGILLAMD